MKIDNRYSLETAEGIDIFITPAGIGPRALAFLIDLLIRGCIVFACSLILNLAGEMGGGLMLIIFFLVEWFYPVIFEITKGATPGKNVYGLTVVYDNGLPISFSGSLTRNLFRTIDFLPFAYVSGIVSIIFSKRCKRLGDLMAGTVVIYKNKRGKGHHFSFEKTDPINIDLNLEQQSAVITFAERCKTLSKQRQIELANILAPLVNCQGEEAVAKLRSLAASLVGKA